MINIDYVYLLSLRCKYLPDIVFHNTYRCKIIRAFDKRFLVFEF